MTKFVNVESFARGATWPSGDPRYCITCSVIGARRKQAMVTANRKDGKFRLPVAYCEGHVPAELKGASA